jgi:hypothetical protein
MKIIIDECLPRRLCKLLPFEQVWTVPQIGLAGMKDTELLKALEIKQIDVFITIDGNIEYQQQFTNRTFGTVVIRAASNRFQDLEPMAALLTEAVSHIEAGNIKRIP